MNKFDYVLEQNSYMKGNKKKAKKDISRYIGQNTVTTNQLKTVYNRITKDEIKNSNLENTMNKIVMQSNESKKSIDLLSESTEEVKEYKFKSPIFTVVGHVDAGKTSLMDVIRNTNKAGQEAGGITQSIGSYFVDINDISEVTKNIKGKFSIENEVPGILMIDTPGHEAFSSMRDRGSSLCDIAILVVDINKGLQDQTKESIKLLKDKKIPFIIAATKLDLIDGWEKSDEINLRKTIKTQTDDVKNNLLAKIEDLKYEFSQFDLKTEFYFNNEKNLKTVYSIVPISSKSKEGLSDLLSLMIFITQNCMSKKISYKEKFDATIMEYNLDKDNGHNIDIILSNGKLSVGDKIVVITSEEPKICSIRKILRHSYDTKRRRNELISEDYVIGSCGVKIMGSNLENCISGSTISKIDSSDDTDACYKLEEAKIEYSKFWKSFSWNSKGVYLIAPKIGEFDAAFNLLKKEKIKMIGGNVTSFNKKVIDRYSSMIEEEKNDEFRVILNFGKVEKKSTLPFAKNSNEYQEFEDGSILYIPENILIIQNDVIYRLVEQYNKKSTEILDKRRKDLSKSGEVIFPCRLQILKNHVYMKGGSDGDDFLFGVRIRAGTLKVGCKIKTSNEVELGAVTSIQKNEKSQDESKLDEEVCIRISNPNGILYGRHFDFKESLYSNLNREIINTLKEDFRKELKTEDWEIVKEIVQKFNIKK